MVGVEYWRRLNNGGRDSEAPIWGGASIVDCSELGRSQLWSSFSTVRETPLSTPRRVDMLVHRAGNLVGSSHGGRWHLPYVRMIKASEMSCCAAQVIRAGRDWL